MMFVFARLYIAVTLNLAIFNSFVMVRVITLSVLVRTLTHVWALAGRSSVVGTSVKPFTANPDAP